MEKDLKIKLEELKKENKIVVGVEQWHENEKKELVNIWEDEKTNILQLLGFLYRKTILKGYNLRINYSYNYSDKQVITITESYQNYDNTITKTRYTFYNLPTNLAYLDIYKLGDIINERKEG